MSSHIESPPSFHGTVSPVDGSGGGGGKNSIGGLGDTSGIDNVTGRMNMAEPCDGHTPGANCSPDERGTRRGHNGRPRP